MKPLWSYANQCLNFFGTPVPKELSATPPKYFYHPGVLRSRAQQLRQALGAETSVFYALKANAYSPILKLLQEFEFGCDVVSGGELKIAIANGFKPQQIVFSGVAKSTEELTEAIALGIHQINVESVPEFLRICHLANELGQRPRVAFRLNPDIKAETHPYIATGFRENKFGMPLQDVWSCVLKIAKGEAPVKFAGLTVHIGSQLLKMSDFKDCFQELANAATALLQTFPELGMPGLDLGGGLGIFYDGDRWSEELHLLSAYAELVNSLREQFPQTNIAIEPGRWLVAHAGALLCQVEYIKQGPEKTFVIVNTGMHHLLRPALYGATHRIFPVKEPLGSKGSMKDVVGPVCESSDTLARQVYLPELTEGDQLVIIDCGAYGFEMASHYNAFAMAERVWLNETAPQ